MVILIIWFTVNGFPAMTTAGEFSSLPTCEAVGRAWMSHHPVATPPTSIVAGYSCLGRHL